MQNSLPSGAITLSKEHRRLLRSVPARPDHQLRARRRMVVNGRAEHGRPGYEPAEDDDDEGRMPLSSDPDRRDRPRLAEESRSARSLGGCASAGSRNMRSPAALSNPSTPYACSSASHRCPIRAHPARPRASAARPPSTPTRTLSEWPKSGHMARDAATRLRCRVNDPRLRQIAVCRGCRSGHYQGVRELPVDIRDGFDCERPDSLHLGEELLGPQGAYSASGVVAQ